MCIAARPNTLFFVETDVHVHRRLTCSSLRVAPVPVGEYIRSKLTQKKNNLIRTTLRALTCVLLAKTSEIPTCVSWRIKDVPNNTRVRIATS